MNREQARKTFAEYTDQYNSADPKIRLKIDHTYRVAELCDRIGRYIGLTGEELDAVWMCGLLHDVGRFEQIRRFGTFMDSKSIDHAKLSAHVLFGDELDNKAAAGSRESQNSKEINMSKEEHIAEAAGINMVTIRSFVEDDSWDELIHLAVYHHSEYRIPKELNEQQRMFCNILRDADKIDILKVNMETPLEDIYNVTTQEVRNSEVTDAVMAAFHEKKAVLRALKKTAADHVVGHISLVFELVYEESREIVKEQGYLKQLLNFNTDNPVTREQFMELARVMEKYI